MFPGINKCSGDSPPIWVVYHTWSAPIHQAWLCEPGFKDQEFCQNFFNAWLPKLNWQDRELHKSWKTLFYIPSTHRHRSVINGQLILNGRRWVYFRMPLIVKRLYIAGKSHDAVATNISWPYEGTGLHVMNHPNRCQTFKTSLMSALPKSEHQKHCYKSLIITYPCAIRVCCIITSDNPYE